ncbi:murein hydrolase activator EnvC family protein [Aurantivibrio infirmus]
MYFARIRKVIIQIVVLTIIGQLAVNYANAGTQILIPESLKSTWLSPIEGFYVMSSFSQIDKINKVKNPGVDIVATANPTVIAPKPGVVIVSAESDPFYPNHKNIIVIDHGNNILTLYSGLQERRVQQGDSVEHGQKIAKAKRVTREQSIYRHGQAKLTHIELIYNGERLNPFKLLPYMIFDRKISASGM